MRSRPTDPITRVTTNTSSPDPALGSSTRGCRCHFGSRGCAAGAWAVPSTRVVCQSCVPSLAHNFFAASPCPTGPCAAEKELCAKFLWVWGGLAHNSPPRRAGCQIGRRTPPANRRLPKWQAHPQRAPRLPFWRPRRIMQDRVAESRAARRGSGGPRGGRLAAPGAQVRTSGSGHLQALARQLTSQAGPRRGAAAGCRGTPVSLVRRRARPRLRPLRRRNLPCPRQKARPCPPAG
jgi:hypothetical protein